jgi:hypothetical protein
VVNEFDASQEKGKRNVFCGKAAMSAGAMIEAHALHLPVLTGRHEYFVIETA